MRLLDTETQDLKFFPESDAPFGARRPPYAILSHTWEADEILFGDIVNQDHGWKQKAGAEKVLGSCQLARIQGYRYIWIDSCCIDKSSSAELSEAINSMFKWYMRAEVCYVYLTDVAADGSIAGCRWFKRGWTLQELIAPESVTFYDKKWHFINDKISISSQLAIITSIDESLLRCGHSLNPPLLKHHDMQAASEKYSGGCSCGRPYSHSRLSQLQDYCVAQKMSWASRRETTRDEDMAYCLLGLFEVNMPLLYGEGGSRAFFRLQREILENSQDQSILAIDYFPRGALSSQPAALASRPYQFLHSGIVHLRRRLTRVANEHPSFYSMATNLTKFGVNVELLIAPEVRPSDNADVSWFGILDCQMGKNPLGRPAILLRPIEESENSSVFCVRGEGLFEISPENPDRARDLRVLAEWSTLESMPDRKIDTQAFRWQKITILQSFDGFVSSIYKESLPAPIRCVSTSDDCPPYSVECESRGKAILQKPGYPRLLLYIFENKSAFEYSSLIWLLEDVLFGDGFVPDNAENAEQILAKLNFHRYDHGDESISLWTKFGRPEFGSHILVVPGASNLMVEAKAVPMKFLDWAMPEVTVTTTQAGPVVFRPVKW